MNSAQVNAIETIHNPAHTFSLVKTRKAVRGENPEFGGFPTEREVLATGLTAREAWEKAGDILPEVREALKAEDSHVSSHYSRGPDLGEIAGASGYAIRIILTCELETP